MADDLVVRDGLKEQGWLDGGYECMPCSDCGGKVFGAKGSIRCKACAAIRAYLERDAQLLEANALIASARHAWEMTRRGRDDLLAQLAAMTVERDSWKGAEAISSAYGDEWARRASLAEAQLTASEAARSHDGNLAWSLLIALAERDDALWTLERVNGRAQEAQFDGAKGPEVRALRDIRAMAERGLRR